MDAPSVAGTVCPRRAGEMTAPAWTRNRLVILGEVAIAALIVAADIRGFIPLSETPFLLLLGWLSLRVRRAGWRSVGLARPRSSRWTLLIGTAFGALYQWAGTFALDPLIERVTGVHANLGDYAGVRGHPAELALYLAFVWTLAAFG